MTDKNGVTNQNNLFTKAIKEELEAFSDEEITYTYESEKEENEDED